MTFRYVFGRRDQTPSSFAPTLGRLCSSAGVVGAALVDADGEAVDYAGRVSPFDIRVAAAEWRIILTRLGRCRHTPWRETRQVMIRGGEQELRCGALAGRLRPRHAAAAALFSYLAPRLVRSRPGNLRECWLGCCRQRHAPVDARAGERGARAAAAAAIRMGESQVAAGGSARALGRARAAAERNWLPCSLAGRCPRSLWCASLLRNGLPIPVRRCSNHYRQGPVARLQPGALGRSARGTSQGRAIRAWSRAGSGLCRFGTDASQ